MRAVVGHLVADAIHDDRVARPFDLASTAEGRHLSAHALRRALAIHDLDERVRERVLAPDDETDDLVLAHMGALRSPSIYFSHGLCPCPPLALDIPIHHFAPVGPIVPTSVPHVQP